MMQRFQNKLLFKPWNVQHDNSEQLSGPAPATLWKVFPPAVILVLSGFRLISGNVTVKYTYWLIVLVTPNQSLIVSLLICELIALWEIVCRCHLDTPKMKVYDLRSLKFQQWSLYLGNFLSSYKCIGEIFARWNHFGICACMASHSLPR